MKKIFRVIAAIIAAAITLALFAALSWWVSTEDSTLGYVAAVLFGIMALLGAPIVYIMIAIEDKTPPPIKDRSKSADTIDAGTMAAAMLVGSSEQLQADDNEVADSGIGDDFTDPD